MQNARASRSGNELQNGLYARILLGGAACLFPCYVNEICHIWTESASYGSGDTAYLLPAICPYMFFMQFKHMCTWVLLGCHRSCNAGSSF